MDEIELLVNSYQTLKKNNVENDDDYLRPIQKILGKMFKYDAEVAVKLWADILESAKGRYTKHDSYDSYLILGQVIGEIENVYEDDYKSAVKILKENPVIFEASFKYDSDLDNPAQYLTWSALTLGEYEFVYNAINLIQQNANASENLADFILEWASCMEEDYLLDDSSDKDGIASFLISQADAVTDETDKARVVTALIDFL